jgi:hypothetical protein
MTHASQNLLPKPASNRWRQWAERLASGHQRAVQRPPRTAQILAARQPLTWQLTQQRHAHYWQLLLPQIKLSWHAWWQETARLSAERIVVSTPSPARVQAEPHLAHRPMNAVSVRQPAVAAPPTTAREAFVFSLPSAVPARAVLTPLQQVVRRMEPSAFVPSVQMKLIVQETSNVLQRVIEQTQRVEIKRRMQPLPSPAPGQTRIVAEPVFASAAKMVPRRNAVVAAADAVATRQAVAMEHRESSWPFPSPTPAHNTVVRQTATTERKEPPWMPPPPPINVEQLTEHVLRRLDERIVAHRERLGKPGW